MHKRSGRLLALAVPLALAGALALSGCTALSASGLGGSGLSGHLVFGDKADAAHEPSSVIPPWLPDDASAIVIDYVGASGDHLMTFTSSDGVTASSSCVPVAGHPALAPKISTDWWPKEALTDGRMQCGDAQLARLGDTWYAYVTG